MEEIKWRSDSEIQKQIGSKIKEWRLELNLPQRELATKAGLSLFTIQQMEYGNSSTLHNLLRALRAMDRLDCLASFFEERAISPIEYEKMVKQTERRRATKANLVKNDKNDNNEPFW